MRFQYYTAQESEQFTFYRIPKALFTSPAFATLSVDAKLLYGLLLDRMGLSRQNGWIDPQGRVYIYFAHAEIQSYLQCGHNKVVRLLRELDQGMGLIQRKKQGLGKPDYIYVMNFTSREDSKASENGNSEAETAQNEGSEAPISDSENESSEDEDSSFETSVPPGLGIQDFSEWERNNTYRNYTENNNIPSIYPTAPEIEEPAPPGIDGMDASKNYATCLRQLWGYEILMDHYPVQTLDSIILLGADVLGCTLPSIRIGGQDIPTLQVKMRLLSLNFTHIEYVLDCIKETTTTVRNMRSYLLTALYNAPTTIDAYYGQMVARDMAT